ncbi:putative C-S lyase [Phragmitibacter flavus]|uniref:cysteine-S-conjugate beta-lyase n=1 Tax=Phragmitibacter flavus TaxID=2576071 RepID=A0A5R8K8Q1_9BACT|nr:PatB family C-S lyase [Phragmitibacter flavus]TLD68698.1 putative C-S lyase [Phragmitibacter flavus]
MPTNFDTVIDRRNTGTLKWGRYENRDILPLWVADMDFAAPDVVLDAIRARLDHGVLGYSAPHPGINESILAYLKRDHQIDAESESIHWLPGLVPAKSMACRAVGQPGEGVIIQTPVYPPFFQVHKDAEMRLIRVPLGRNDATNGSWAIDFDALEASVTPDTRVFLFCNPHNPVGRAWSEQDVRRIADFCLRHHLLLVSDEIHCDLILDPTIRHFSAARLEGPIRKNLIVLMAASKTYNLPGLSLAFALIPDASLRIKFKAAGGKLIPELNPLSYHATQAAFDHAEPWRQDLLSYLRANRDYLQSYLAEHIPQIKMALPLEATYLAWLDPRELAIERPQPFFEAAGVGLSEGADFGAPGFLRLNFGCPRSTLEEALNRMKNALAARK